MFRKIVPFILLFFSVSYCRGCLNRVLVDSLFSGRFVEKFRQDEVLAILSKLANERCSENDSAIAIFSTTNTFYGHWAIGVLARNHSSVLPELFRRQSEKLTKLHWSYFANNLSKSSCWNNTTIDSIVVNAAYQNADVATRVFVLQYLAKCAALSTCESLVKRYYDEPKSMVKKCHLIIYTRFKSSELNALVLAELKASPYIFGKIIRNGFKQYNRYDFLPELYTLKKRLQKEDNPLRKKDAEKILATLKDVIPYLEKKKAEKAEIGLPLDWGLEKDESK